MLSHVLIGFALWSVASVGLGLIVAGMMDLRERGAMQVVEHDEQPLRKTA